MNDSGWYFMNVHFVNTGDYITESRYPSFVEPSQLYSFFGYSLFLYFCEKLGLLFGTGFPFMVKYGQLLMYLFSAILVRNIIFSITQKQKLAYGLGILFLLYYPYFNYVNLVMSEVYATFLILLTCYLFIKIQTELKRLTTIILFLLCGYIILVKPVLLPLSLLIMFIYIITVIQARKWKYLWMVLFICVFPLSQSIFSKAYYNNFNLQTGVGWHLWNRVVYYDGQIPKESKTFKELKEIYKKEGKEFTVGYWWDVSKDLSELGYSELETQKICEKVAKDAMKEKPFEYLWLTFVNSYDNFLMNNPEDRVYQTSSEYINEIENFSSERQHKPLTDHLLKQKSSISNGKNEPVLYFNFKYAELSNYIILIINNRVVLLLFVLAGIHTMYNYFSSRFKRNTRELVLWFAAFSIIFGSNLAEFPQSRLIQPSIIFVMMVIALKCYELKNKIKSKSDSI